MLDPQQFIHPAGELMEVSFPDGDLLESLLQWITNASIQVVPLSESIQEMAATQLVYGMAYRAIAARVANQPNETKSFNDVTESWGADRIRFWESRAEAKFAAFEQIAGSSADNSADLPAHGSVSAAVRSTW